MTFIGRILNALWDALAKWVLPEPVMRIDRLDLNPEDIEREHLHHLENGRGKTRLRATWRVEDFVADISHPRQREQEHAHDNNRIVH